MTLLGAGADRTRVSGEAHFGLAVRPFIQYFEPPGEVELMRVALRDVAMKDFTLDGGDEYPSRRAEDVAGLLALVMAVSRYDVAEVRALLDRKPALASARILSPDASGEGSTLLHHVVSVSASASDEQYEIARLLIAHGADVDADGGQARGRGESALGYAGFFGDTRLVALYLEHGADPNRVSSTGLTPVDATAHEGSHVAKPSVYLPSFEALIEAGGRFDLGHLILLQHTERLVAALDADPGRVNVRIELRHFGPDETGTLLHEAADGCFPDIVALLLDRGAEINAVDNMGQTALRRAVNRGDYNDGGCGKVIETLLDRGAETDFLAPVIVADAERVAAMLAKDTQLIHSRDGDGWTLLDLAVKHGHDEIEKLLRAAGGTLSQNLGALFREAGPDHSVHKVLAQSAAKSASPGYMHVEPSPSLDIPDEITLAAWIYRLDGGGTVVGKWHQPDSWSYVLHLPGDGFRLRWEDDTQDHLTGFHLPYLEWAHYAATYDGISMKVYVNDELVSEHPARGKRIKSTKNPVWIGSTGYRDKTSGLIDDVQIWNVARTQAQIQQSMRDGLNGDEPGLVGWWPMDSQPLRDRSSHANHGNLAGEAAFHSDDVPGDDRHAPQQVLWLLPFGHGDSASSAE